MKPIWKCSCIWAVLVLLAASTRADEFPPLCAQVNGGLGDISVGSVQWFNGQAHVGDTVQLGAVLGMVAGACEAIQATGSIYTARGLLVNFLENATLDPGFIYQCPTNTTPPCNPGPYAVTITADMVGAGVVSPLGAVAGVPRFVRALENGVGLVRSGEVLEPLWQLHGASIQIVSPAITLAATSDLPPGKSCFPTDGLVQISGVVSNSGDVTLINVVLQDSPSNSVMLINPANGLPLNLGNPVGPVTLQVGAYATFSFSYAPTAAQVAAGSATNILTVAGTDTSDIGGPRASVTKLVTVISPLCGPETAPGLLSIRHGSETVVMSWAGAYHLQVATNVAGPYFDVPAPLHGPYTNPPRGPGAWFFRLRE